ncbi:Peroxisomal sarcosine oxidase [Chionoecetes opilio]|uniref:Peroxisomal sarcosine oxidase n=1 Tax=Chionoecetes opilio TaxID=41210 RepID=A0A8J4Y8I0_CHIOP|nr:Peroxisomal sarcosine oxidase [Chionoecetes opilio]
MMFLLVFIGFQFRLPHNHGSSCGQARIIRLANTGPPQLTPIMDDAYKHWIKISNIVNEELISPAPMLMVSRTKDRIKKAAASMELGGQAPVWLTPAQTNAKYSTNFTDDFMMFEDTTAGVMRADRCVAAVQIGEDPSSLLEEQEIPSASFVDLTASNYLYGLPALDSAGCYKSRGSINTNRVLDSYSLLLYGAKSSSTVYTVSPDGECILDRCPKHPNIIFATGFTGTGFKLAPTVGNILAGMVLGRDHGFDVSPFGAARFDNFKTQYHLNSKY